MSVATVRILIGAVRLRSVVSQISIATVRFLLPAGGEREYAAAVSRTEGAMRHEEYERRRRALEAQLREDLELLRAGYQAKLRALEMLWLAPPGEALPEAVAVSETLRLSETLASSETLPKATPPQSETVTPPERPKETRRGQVRDEIEAAFAELPEEFDRRDVLRVLGYEPPRATLFRVLEQLVADKWISVAWYSNGRSSTRYAKLPEPAGETV
jgi:hypothetical protein